jgi:methanogenic corrinoid protein MtbC1
MTPSIALQIALQELPPVSRAALQAFEAREPELSAAVRIEMERSHHTRALIRELHSSVLSEMNRHHVRFLAAGLKLRHPPLLANTLCWFYRVYRARGVAPEYFPLFFDIWGRTAAAIQGKNAARELAMAHGWLARHHAEIQRAAEAAPDGAVRFFDPPWGDIRSGFLARLLEADARAAMRMAQQAVSSATDVQTFYLNVIHPCMEAIGRRWERFEISTAQEHLATALVGRIMSVFYERHVVAPGGSRKAVVTAAPNELHEMGARMVADFMEMDGWSVAYVGADTPVEDLLRLLDANRAEVLAVSVTMPFNIEAAREMVARVKAASAGSGPKVVVGGRILNELPDLSGAVAADGFAVGPHEAVRMSNRWTRQGVPA